MCWYFLPNIVIVNIECEKTDSHQNAKTRDSEHKPKQRRMDSFKLFLYSQSIDGHFATLKTKGETSRQ